MTHLRALVGAAFLLSVMGFVVSVPLGWDLVLVAARKSISSTPMQPLPSNLRFSRVLARPTEKRSSRADHTSGKKSWCRRRFCHVPHTAYEGDQA
jgi:hypothetical protein